MTKIEVCNIHSPLSVRIQELQAILPDQYEHTVCEFSDMGSDQFKTLLRLNITTEKAARTWLKDFQDKSRNTFRVQWNDTNHGERRKNVFKVILRCQHNTMSRNSDADKKASSKNTGCPSNMTITVKRVISNRKSRSNDIHAKKFPMMVQLLYNHNHPLQCADVLKHRDVGDSVTKKFLTLFESGHSPSTALQAHKYDLHDQHGDNYVYVSADRFECPDLQWCFRLYYKTFKKHYGEPDGERMLVDLEKKLTTYNTNDTCVAKMTRIGDNICICLCTPLMKRVHKYIRQSGEIVFVDSSGGVDRHGCRVFLMMTHTCAGGLPLGVMVTTSEAEEIITEGLKLLRSLLPSDAFFNRGERGPAVFMTDDSESERKALYNVFPQSNRLLCIFHILQAMWRFLWDAKHNITKGDRPHLLRLVKCLVYAETEDKLQESYVHLLSDMTVRKYKCFSSHVKHLYERRKVWAICFRKELPIRGNNTNNYCESAMRILKDKIFVRTKAFNMVQLVDFLFTRLEKYYEQKLLDVANNRLDRAISSRYISSNGWDLPVTSIQRLSDHEFVIPSQKTKGTSYNVDMDFGMCSCAIGVNGGPCKHQHMITKHFFISNLNTSPQNSPSLRHLFFKVAMGREMDDAWFSSLHSGASNVMLEKEDTPMLEKKDTTDEEVLTPDTDQETMEVEEELDIGEQFDSGSFDRSLEKFVNTLKRKRINYPEIFNGPIRKFFRNFNNIKTDSALVSALSTFGKYSGVGSSRFHQHSKKVGKMIGVQPTAVARRKTPLGGRRSLGSGRPTKKAAQVTSDTGKTVNPKLMPKKRPSKAPHNLATCVSNNVSLGKTHSAKK